MSRVTPEALHAHVSRRMDKWEKEGVSIGPEGTIWVGECPLRLRAVSPAQDDKEVDRG